MDNFTAEELEVIKEGYYSYFDPNLGCQGFHTALDIERKWFWYACEKLNIKEGDFVIVKGLSAENAYKFAIDLEGKIPPKTIICFLQDGETIENLDEKEMAKNGWVRKTK